MNISLILIIIGLILIFFLSFKLLKGVIKAAVTVLIILTVLVVTSGILIYNDATMLKQGLRKNETTIIITQEKKLVTAFKATMDVSLTSAIKQDYYETLTKEEMEKISKQLENKEFDKIEKDNFLLIMDQKIFYDDVIEIEKKEINLTKNILEDFANSQNIEDAIIALSETDISKSQLKAFEAEELDNLKSKIYYSLFLNKIKDTKGKFLIDEIKNKNITTKPELMSIKLLNFFPELLIEKLTTQISKE